MAQRVYLSRRNLNVLLSKLDRKKAGDVTACTIIKDNFPGDHPFFNDLFEPLMIVAIEDEDLYSNREPGEMHPADERKQ